MAGGSFMIDAIERYLEMRKRLGYLDQDLARNVREFARFATDRGATHLNHDLMLEWIGGSSQGNYRRTRRIDWLANLGKYLRAEDERHELLPASVLARREQRKRLIPFFYEEADTLRIMNGFARLELPHPFDAVTYSAIIGLIAATGLRLSEALNICLADVNLPEIRIRKGKFGKDRLIFVSESTTRAIRRYLRARPPELDSQRLFVIRLNRAPSVELVDQVFRRCTRSLAMHGRTKSGPPRIHDFRHTFAIKSLARCAHDEKVVANHIVALSTYLGHVSVADTYWYLRLLPSTKLEILNAMEGMRNA
jgi:integrase/recombinase XerD